jgi:glycosidase
VRKPLSVLSIVAIGAVYASACCAQTRARQSVDWVRNAVVYEAYLRSFSANSSFAELQARLPELKRLGVTVVWVMPIHPVGKEKRKGSLGSPYAVRDYYAVNPEFGALDDFRKLVNAVHAADMKIIIDLVINHTAWDNALVKRHPQWYRRDDKGKILFPANWDDVAHLDFRNADLRRYMVEMMCYWVRDVDIDGFRCDVAGMVPLDFWDAARIELEKIKPVMMLAESSEPAEHLRAFDLTYAWNLRDALLHVLRDGKPATLIAETLAEDSRRFPPGSLRLRFSSNHDQNAWEAPAIEMYGPQGAKAAAVLTCTLPGAPLLYNGDEVGNTKKLALFEKVVIDWSHDPYSMRTFHEELLKTRRQFPAFVRGSIEFVRTGEPDSVVAFMRQADAERVLVAVNTKPTEKRVRLPVAAIAWGNGREDDGEIVLPPFGYVIGRVK